MKKIKTYWGYNDCGTTYLFNSFEEALDHAVGHGVFDEVVGRDAIMALEEALFFEVSEDKLEDHEPYLIKR